MIYQLGLWKRELKGKIPRYFSLRHKRKAKVVIFNEVPKSEKEAKEKCLIPKLYGGNEMLESGVFTWGWHGIKFIITLIYLMVQSI